MSKHLIETGFLGQDSEDFLPGPDMTRASSFTRQQLEASGRGELFASSDAKLPADPMLMFDRIVEINADGGKYGKGFIRAELDIRPDLWFFQCHFIGDPVMPGCLGLDAMWQLVGFYLTCWTRPVAVARWVVARSSSPARCCPPPNSSPTRSTSAG